MSERDPREAYAGNFARDNGCTDETDYERERHLTIHTLQTSLYELEKYCPTMRDL